MVKVTRFFMLVFGMSLISHFAQATVMSSVVSAVESDPYYKQCLEVRKYLVGSKYEVQCNKAYHHYNSSSWKSVDQGRKFGTIKIGSFNLLHPGNARTAFKDIDLVAKVIDNYDVVSALELLPVIGRDLVNNENVIKLIENNPNESKAKRIYRAPGYLKILEALRKLDSSWALILTPKGEAAKASNVHELAGFYYRSSKVRPIENEHCHEFYRQKRVGSFACFPELSKEFMKKDSRQVFSRRPFMGSFKSGNFDFSLITSHVIYNSPDDFDTIKRILGPSFGINHYRQLDETGFTQATFARFAEAKIILELIENLKHYYKEQDVIYAGDMNLGKDNPFWKKLMSSYKDSRVLVDGKTTLAKQKFDREGKETHGLSSNYDHFIVNLRATRQECANRSRGFRVQVDKFFSGEIYEDIKKKYLVRGRLRKSVDFKPDHYDYVLDQTAERKMNSLVRDYKQEVMREKTVRDGEIVFDRYRVEKRVSNFKRRVFFDQLKNVTYYKLYQELISDHLPIVMDCTTRSRDDD